jgi:hypothetical protein
MPQEKFQYRVVHKGGELYGVEVTEPGKSPRMLGFFGSEKLAQRFVDEINAPEHPAEPTEQRTARA